VASLGKVSAAKDGEGLRIGIAYTKWNETVINALKAGCVNQLCARGVKVEDIFELQTSGSYELPHTATCLIAKHNLDAVVCIGCLIKGETMHFDYICEAVTQGIMRINLDTGVPCLFGVLTVLTQQQADARAGLTNGANHGVEWADAAVDQGNMKRECRPGSLCRQVPGGSTPLWTAALVGIAFSAIFQAIVFKMK